jgi:hypothetical protein
MKIAIINGCQFVLFCEIPKQGKTRKNEKRTVFFGFTVNRGAVQITENTYEYINEKSNQVRAGDTRRHHQRGHHGPWHHGLHEPGRNDLGTTSSDYS